MPYVPYKKGTLLIPSGPGKHLFAIISDKCANNQHLLVNVTSIQPGVAHDDACELAVGDHPFIKQPSYVAYRLAVIQHADKLTKFVDGWYYTQNTDISDALLQRMRDGVLKSKFVPKFVKTYFEDEVPP